MNFRRNAVFALCLFGACYWYSPVKAGVNVTMGALVDNTESSAGEVLRGKIVDEAGVPVIGASVIVPGTDTRTVTDVNGNFSLNKVRNGVKIEVSYIGYAKLISSLKDNQTLVLKEDNRQLNEVVVVGYGNMRRKDVTSSITTVRSEDLNVGVFQSPAQLLQGKVPGLQITTSSDPNSSPSITLRGASTLREGAAMEPYYVIDGVPGMDISLVAPEDIESIDVLRDASATAIYGSKAANGVILITTKRGKAGKTQVSYSGYVAFDRVAKNLDMMSADEYRSYVQDNGLSIDPTDDLGYNTDWQKEVQRTGISHNHNLAISGGAGNTSYSVSLNYFSNDGVIKGTDLQRYNGRAFLGTKALNNRLDLSFNINASITEQNQVPDYSDGASVYDAMNYYLPFSPVKNEDGSWFEHSSRTQYYNPVALINENIDYTKSKRIQGTAKAGFEILKGLKYNLMISYENEQVNNNLYFSSNSLLASGMNGRAQRSSVENESKVLETYLNYDKTFKGGHKLGLMAGYSWQEDNDNDGFQLRAYGFYSDDLTYHNLGMANFLDRTVDGLGNYNLSTLRMISFYARANYSYNSKYLFQATVRRDGSSAFGANNRWATFPSVSAAWRLSEEEFIKKLNIFDDLKFRIGYGVSGNSLGFDAFTARQVYGVTGWFTNSKGEEVHTIGATRNANPDLKWERTSMFNVGIDFGFFNNRLTGTIEYYDKRTKDLIYDYPVSTTEYLYNYLTANVGEISNKGIEITINAVPVQTKDFTWSTSLNLSHNKNVVEKLSNREFSVDYIDMADLGGAGQSNCYQQRIMEGHPIGQFYTWEWAGYNDEGVSVYYVHDPETGERTGETTTSPTQSDRACTGSAQPKLTLGWNNTLTYKRFSLTAFFQGTFGNKIMNGTKARLSNIADAGIRNWISSFPEENIASDFNSHFLSDRYLEDGSYFRLSSLSLSYDFGNIGKWISNLKVTATCNNVFTITGYSGLDPEVNLGGLTPGIDNRYTYPRTRTFMLGVNLNF
ncbi:tonB-dependent receptor plug [Prevotella sp. CAG:1185]|uniref:SusC/RagA family TonB-linked outer membrane protein n=1 Tax=uncultured Prevotella sp. TaxID=159272 RepID=UPI00033DA579|nr:TonB-dependent receptor [uncultured Prevotella sp.]CCY82795.1 tonB-dependent receptor plug [Prevotella sp. CAG:1185]